MRSGRLRRTVFPLVDACMKIVAEDPVFFLINSYTTGLAPSVLKNILFLTMGARYGGKVEADEVGLPITNRRHRTPLRLERTVAAVTFDVLYEDNHLLAVVKPQNVPVQADESGDDDLLSEPLADILKSGIKSPARAYLGLVHRLDRPVGGAMVFARTSKAAQRLQEAMQSRSGARPILAVVCGSSPEHAKLTDYLFLKTKQPEPPAWLTHKRRVLK